MQVQIYCHILELLILVCVVVLVEGQEVGEYESTRYTLELVGVDL